MNTMQITPKNVRQANGKYIEFKPQVVYYSKSYLILGDNHTNKILIKDYPTLLTKYLALIQLLAKDFGVFFEGGLTKPIGPIPAFLTRYKVSGKFNTWESTTVKNSPEQVLLLDIIGSDYGVIKNKLGTINSGTILQKLSEKSNKYTREGTSITEKQLLGLFEKK